MLPPPQFGSAVLPQLADPRRYVACAWDFSDHIQQRAYWVALYRRNFPRLLEEAMREAAARGESADITADKCRLAREHLFAFIDRLEKEGPALGRVDILRISTEREVALRLAGIADPFRLAKEEGTRGSLQMLPARLAELDALPSPDRAEQAVRGILAGNLFDLNAAKTAELFKQGKLDFHDTLAAIKPRPWKVDHLDAWLEKLSAANASGRPPYRQAVLFLDNAGSDAILGMLPFARDLAARGVNVLLSANPTPSLNDITHAELQAIVQEVAGWDATLAQQLRQGRMRLVHSGNPAPLIDLTRLSQEIVDAAREADLVVLEGMGRAIESNWEAQFTCDSIRTAMIKDGGVAWVFGWEIYDTVFRFEPGAGQPPR